MRNQNIIITGATDGMGKVAATRIADQGASSCWPGCRGR